MKFIVILIFFFVTSCLSTWKCRCFFLAKCVRNTVKAMVVDRKKPKSTSSAIFGVETAAKSYELKRCADRVCNRTDEANLNFLPELYRLIFFAFHQKDNWVFFWTFFFAINKSVFDFCCLCLFCYNVGQHAISCQKHGIQHRVISSVWNVLVTLWCGRTDVQTDGHVTITSLPKFLGLIDYQISLVMVLCWRTSAQAPLIKNKMFSSNPNNVNNLNPSPNPSPRLAQKAQS